jgi:RNA polymerase sigma factor (sigma-70 family)
MQLSCSKDTNLLQIVLRNSGKWLQVAEYRLMEPRKDLVEIFSTFLRLEADRVAGWSTDLRLQRHMITCLQAAPKIQSDHLWALHWHQLWQPRSHPFAEAHLSAYLQENGYWVARKIAQNQRQLREIADFFQVAIAQVPKLLKHFNPQYSESLKKYAELVFENSLKDWLRVQQQVEVCTDWALLYRLSRKRLVAALQASGLSQPSMAQYILAWECFQELARIDQPRMNTLSRPPGETWQAIAAAYNAERLSQVGAGTPMVNPDQLEHWLLTCAQLVRQSLKPTVISADAPKPGQESNSLLDSLIAPAPTPMDQLLNQEADTARTQHRTQLQTALANAFADLDPSDKMLLKQYYGDQLTQNEIAKQLDIQQFKVSRRLQRIRRSLGKKVAQWSQETLHIIPTPTVVDAISHSLIEEWLREKMPKVEE